MFRRFSLLAIVCSANGLSEAGRPLIDGARVEEQPLRDPGVLAVRNLRKAVHDFTHKSIAPGMDVYFSAARKGRERNHCIRRTALCIW